LRLLVINTSSSSSVKNDGSYQRLVSSTCHGPAPLRVALGGRNVHSTRWSQILAENREFCPSHLHLTPPLGEFPSEYCHNDWCGKGRMVGLPDGKKILNIRLFVSTPYTNVTDGQTDTTRRRRRRLCKAPRNKNVSCPLSPDVFFCCSCLAF